MEGCCYPPCTQGLESVGGWLLRVVSAEAPGRSYVNICAELSGVETELTVALGSGEEEWGGSRRANLEAWDGVSVSLFSAQRWFPVLFDLRGSRKPLYAYLFPQGCLKHPLRELILGLRIVPFSLKTLLLPFCVGRNVGSVCLLR